jgi:hypothetical protein
VKHLAGREGKTTPAQNIYGLVLKYAICNFQYAIKKVNLMHLLHILDCILQIEY